MKWERISLGSHGSYYRATDERGRVWELDRDSGGWNITCNGKYQGDVERAFGALAEAKQRASELAQRETVRV